MDQENENGITISGASIAKGVGGVIATLVAGAIFYVASAIPKIETDIAVISAGMQAMKESDRAQWEKIIKVDERVTSVREYLAEKGWAKDNHNK